MTKRWIITVALGATVCLIGCATASTTPTGTVNIVATPEPSATSPMGYELGTDNDSLVYPLTNYSTFEIVSYVKDNTAHTGIDILAPEGAEVLSIGDGTVRTVGNKNFYGYRVLIDYIVKGSLISVTYGHLNPETPLKAGDTVVEGQVIAEVGGVTKGSGYTIPRLHFGVQQNYTELDPQVWLTEHVTHE